MGGAQVEAGMFARPLLLLVVLGMLAGCARPGPDAVLGPSPPTGSGVADIVSPTSLGKDAAPATAWPVGMHDLRGSRAALDETKLTSENVAELGLAWSFKTNGSATGTVTVKDGVAYAATWKGFVYALDLATGEPRWTHEHGAQVDAPVTPWEDLVLYGDAKGVLTALHAKNGTVAWSTLLDNATSTHLYATPVVHDGVVLMGVASDQESTRIHGDRPVDFRGSMAALDARTGKLLWQTVLVPEGYVGAPVWGTPVVADELGLLVLGTGNAYAEPVGDMTDSIVALRLEDGSVAWSFQATKDDVFTQANPASPDWDFGSTPTLFESGGRLLVGLGQKSSRYWALDAASGDVVWKNGPTLAGQGITGGSGLADGLLVVPHATQKRVAALHAENGTEAWSHPMPGVVISSPAIVPGAVLAADSTGALVALGLHHGQVLWNASTGAAGGVFGGLSVADGALLVPTVEKAFLGEHGFILAYRAGAKGTVGAGGGAARPAGEVGLLNVAFQPDTLTVAPGTKVTWVNEDAIFHTATSGWDRGATFDFPLQPGQRASWTFDEPGTYQVYCKPHASPNGQGGWDGMVMAIVVEAGGPE